MWIVRLALRRPYTFAVFAILLLLVGASASSPCRRISFRTFDIPVVSIIWQYAGLSARPDGGIASLTITRTYSQRQRSMASSMLNRSP